MDTLECHNKARKSGVDMARATSSRLELHLPLELVLARTRAP